MTYMQRIDGNVDLVGWHRRTPSVQMPIHPEFAP